MDLIQLGAQMRQEREARKLSLADVTEATKISRRILVAFENGEMEHFPHPVYAKGFVRNYAKLLGLDPLECVRVLEREYCPDELPEDKRDNVGISLKDLKDPSGKALSSGTRPWGAMIIVLLLVGVLAGLIWYMAQSGHEQKARMEETVAPVEAAIPADEPVVVEQAPEESVAEVPAGNVEASAGVVDNPAESAGGQDMTAQEQPATKEHVLVVTVTDKDACWMGVFRKEQETGDTPWLDEFTVRPGQSLRYEFTGSRTFRFGRLETVSLELDGKPRPASGSGVVDVILP
jgi:cytoskeleton protein RodZ